MSVTVNRRTTKGTCFQRGASLYGAGVGLGCAEELVTKGNFKQASETLHFAVGLRIDTVRLFLPKPIAKEATSFLKEVGKVGNLVKNTKAPKKEKIKAVAALEGPWRKLTSKVEKLCGAPED